MPNKKEKNTWPLTLKGKSNVQTLDIDSAMSSSLIHPSNTTTNQKDWNAPTKSTDKGRNSDSSVCTTIQWKNSPQKPKTERTRRRRRRKFQKTHTEDGERNELLTTFSIHTIFSFISFVLWLVVAVFFFFFNSCYWLHCFCIYAQQIQLIIYYFKFYMIFLILWQFLLKAHRLLLLREKRSHW